MDMNLTSQQQELVNKILEEADPQKRVDKWVAETQKEMEETSREK